jgi:hypothetical protein
VGFGVGFALGLDVNIGFRTGLLLVVGFGLGLLTIVGFGLRFNVGRRVFLVGIRRVG